jgi:hypothetical protein
VRTFVNVYGQPQPQEPCYPREAVMAAVEECMRKQADGLLHSLEGIGGRLSQLELYCYKLERSIGELRSDVMDYHSDATVNFRCIDKNIRQVRFHEDFCRITRSVCTSTHYIPCSPSRVLPNWFTRYSHSACSQPSQTLTAFYHSHLSSI